MNDNPEDIAVDTNTLDWTELSEGIAFKVLRLSQETGTWTVIFRCQPGSTFAPHLHLGAGEYYVIKGRMDYRAGTANSGGYGYEPLGVFHEKTVFPEYTELYFTNHGPVAFVDEQKNITSVLDVRFFQDIVDKLAA
jgi:anti-sigma factor ChrR (cupin superfamily)